MQEPQPRINPLTPRRDYEMPVDHVRPQPAARRPPDDLQINPPRQPLQPRGEPDYWADVGGWDLQSPVTHRRPARQEPESTNSLDELYYDSSLEKQQKINQFSMSFYQAVRDGHFVEFKHLYKEEIVNHSKLDLNCYFEYGSLPDCHLSMAPVHLICVKGFTGMLDWMYEQNVSMERKSISFMRRPIHFTVMMNRVGCFNRLVHWRVELDAQDRHGNTPLAYCADSTRPIMLDVLLSKEVRSRYKVDYINIGDMNGKTPLMKAVHSMKKYNTRKLCDAGADINAKDSHGNTALHYAVNTHDFTCGHILILMGADVNKPNKNGETPLMTAVQAHNIEAISALIKAGCNVNARDTRTNSGETALHIACRHNNKEMADLLLRSGRIRYQFNYSDELPLYDIIVAKRMGMLMLFVKHNYDISRPIKMTYDGTGGKTAVHVALEVENFKILDLLTSIGYQPTTPPPQPWLNYPYFRGMLLDPVELTPREQEHLKRFRTYLAKIGYVIKLQKQVRRFIRTLLGYNVEAKLRTLGLPTATLQFLLLDDIKIDPYTEL